MTQTPTRTLLVDNYDSFTYNLYQLLYAINGVAPIVRENATSHLTWDMVAAYEVDNIVISPGPGSPDRPADFGVCADILAHETRPVLGVCLGMQGIWIGAGGRLERAPEAMHGRVSNVAHDGRDLFEGLPSPFSAVRYHSLAVVGETPADLEVTARSEDGVVMGLAHKTRPQWGVQFHPESILTEHGRALLENFRRLSVEHAVRVASESPG